MLKNLKTFVDAWRAYKIKFFIFVNTVAKNLNFKQHFLPEISIQGLR